MEEFLEKGNKLLSFPATQAGAAAGLGAVAVPGGAEPILPFQPWEQHGAQGCAKGKCQLCLCIPALPLQSGDPWEQPGPRIPHSEPIHGLLEAVPGSRERRARSIPRAGIGNDSRGAADGAGKCILPRAPAQCFVGPHPCPSTAPSKAGEMQPGFPALLPRPTEFEQLLALGCEGISS